MNYHNEGTYNSEEKKGRLVKVESISMPHNNFTQTSQGDFSKQIELINRAELINRTQYLNKESMGTGESEFHNITAPSRISDKNPLDEYIIQNHDGGQDQAYYNRGMR